MKFVLVLLILAAASTAQAQDILDWYRGFQQQQVVEVHPRTNEPVTVAEVDPANKLMPPYLAKKYLHGDDYVRWALTWNNYQDEVAERSIKTYTYFGSDTMTSTFQQGGLTRSHTSVRPRVWTRTTVIPGEIRYNPFVAPIRE